MRTTNDVPLYGIDLFGSDILPILSNVAASGLGSVFYAPPSPSEPLKLASISPVRAKRGSTLTLTGNGFGYPESNNIIVFTTAAGTVETAPATASFATLTAVVPPAAMTGPVFVRTGGQT